MKKPLPSFVEHTLLRPDSTRQEITRLCEEARRHGFRAVCVNGSRVVQAYSELEDCDACVNTVVAFPFGAMESDAKRYETEVAIDNGASEIDLVPNLGWLQDGEESLILREIRDVVEAADGHPVKVILETGLLAREQIVIACKLVMQTGALFVKTSTGYGPSGASVEEVALLRETVGTRLSIKAAGGIQDLDAVRQLIAAGADRIGTSHGVAIIKQLEREGVGGVDG